MKMGVRSMNGGSEELGFLFRDQPIDQRELDMYRSGSAPPTLEGSLVAMERIKQDELWSNSQRLRFQQSSTGDSLWSSPQSGFGSKEEAKAEWHDKEHDGLLGLSLRRQKSFAEILQDDLGHPSHPLSCNAFNDSSKPLRSHHHLALHHERISVDSIQHNVKTFGAAQNNGLATSNTFASVVSSSFSRNASPGPQLLARAPSPGLPPVGVRISNTDKKNHNGSRSFKGPSGMMDSGDLVASLSALSLSATNATDDDITVQANIQRELEDHKNFMFGLNGSHNDLKQHHLSETSDTGHLNILSGPESKKTPYTDLARGAGAVGGIGNTTLRQNELTELYTDTISPVASYAKAPSSYMFDSPDCSAIPSQNLKNPSSFISYELTGYSGDTVSAPIAGNYVGNTNFSPYRNAATAGLIAFPGKDSRALAGSLKMQRNLTGAGDLQSFNKIRNHAAAVSPQTPLMDNLYVQYLRSAEYAAQMTAGFSDPLSERGYMDSSYLDLLGIQHEYLGAMLQLEKQLGKSGNLNHGYYDPTFGLGMPYPGSPLEGHMLPTSLVGPGSPIRLGERSMRFPSGARNLAGGVIGPWHSDISNISESYPSSLLEEFKNNKIKSYELSDIAGHVVDFSADQYGSRFIQQKLETASTNEKSMVYDELMPRAFQLMTDVFGNYVIQKFFEHGSAAQKRELADKLTGHVLTLSLQMYGCRVIQKALEVVDLDQQTRMVAELDGHIMRCVRDQNGNHVIQKCIECIPQDVIQFIVSSFYDQVVILSTHPYGCRVIQRVLEHCDDPKTQQIMIDEILPSVCMLAQDQYGNYVVQHVPEHGKPHERSFIIKKLAGQIVRMSQQKYASNVVEKCLTFGGPAERQILVNEILGTTDENEPLQAMMKDQFANYVVQKILETCDDQQREYILSRIKVHLNALKKYTYGKHIVVRLEKLVATGERKNRPSILV